MIWLGGNCSAPLPWAGTSLQTDLMPFSFHNCHTIVSSPFRCFALYASYNEGGEALDPGALGTWKPETLPDNSGLSLSLVFFLGRDNVLVRDEMKIRIEEYIMQDMYTNKRAARAIQRTKTKRRMFFFLL